MAQGERRVWGVYDCRDYYVVELQDNKLYVNESEANRVRDALGEGFVVRAHVLVE